MIRIKSDRAQCDYTLKHAKENPTGKKFLESVPNGVCILAARMLGTDVVLSSTGQNACICVWFICDPTDHRDKYFPTQYEEKGQ